MRRCSVFKYPLSTGRPGLHWPGHSEPTVRENEPSLGRQLFHGKGEQNDTTVVSSRTRRKHLLERNTSQIKGGKREPKETEGSLRESRNNNVNHSQGRVGPAHWQHGMLSLL